MTTESRPSRAASLFTLLLLFAVLAATSSANAARGHRKVDGSSAPSISSVGKTLYWDRVFGASRYEVLRNIPGQRSQIFYVKSTSVIAYGYSCKTLGYKVRAAIWGEWSTETRVSYSCSTHLRKHTHVKHHRPRNEEEQILAEVEREEHKVRSKAARHWCSPHCYRLLTEELQKCRNEKGSGHEEEEKQAHEREAREKQEREARERSEREAKEKAEKEHHEEKEEEPPEEPPEEHESFIGFHPGVDQGTEAKDFSLDSTLKPKVVRIEFGASEKELAQHIKSVDSTLAGKGVELQPLIGFAGRMLSSSEAKGLAEIPKLDPRIKDIELGNETSFSYQYHDSYAASTYKERARLYAVRVRESAEAVAPYGAGIEAQAEDGGSGSPVWVNEMFAAVPNLTQYVAAWTIHPYSSQKSASEADTYGIPKMQRMVADLAARGNTKTPIAVTEWGETSENGKTLSDGKHLTFAEAAQLARTQIPQLRAAAKEHKITTFIVYQLHDQRAQGIDTEREHYFGVYQLSGAPKGEYTGAIERLMAE